MRSLVVRAAPSTAGHVQGLLSLNSLCEGREDPVLIGRGTQWTGGTRLAERRNLVLQRMPTPAVNDLWPDPTDPAG
jgi:hypothetical protein